MKILNIIGKIILYLTLVILAIVTVFPILYSLTGSFKENMELMVSSTLFTKSPTIDNYKYVWETVNFSKYTLNSLIITVSVVIGSIFTATMSGYVLSRKVFPGKKLIRSLYMWSMFISLGPAVLYPIFKLIVDVKLNSTYMGVILVQVGAQVANMILVEGYLEGISKDFDEAAKIDGCGFFRIYWNIILPLIKPMVAIIGLLTFKSSWNDYLMPMIITMGNKALTPLTVAVVELKSSGQMASLWSVMLAGTCISVVPVMVVYIFTNKQFIAGLTIGGVKG